MTACLSLTPLTFWPDGTHSTCGSSSGSGGCGASHRNSRREKTMRRYLCREHSGWASPSEYRAAQSRQASPEEAQGASWGTAKAAPCCWNRGRRAALSFWSGGWPHPCQPL
eukprot:scaffold113636_cov54-Phaeocystis_antarctica.AAC.2